MSMEPRALQLRIETLERENLQLRQEQAERQTYERDLLRILEVTPAPIYLKDAQFCYILVNRRYEALAHVAQDALKGLTDYDIFPAVIADVFRHQDEEILRSGKPQEFEETIHLPDGEFTFITVKFPVFGPLGQVHAVGGFCTDITARKKWERERETLIEDLRRAHREVASLQTILPICSWCKKIRDDQGYWNQLETYFSDHSDMAFTHGICPACAAKCHGMNES